MCAGERDSERVCVCVCVREREREREIVSERGSQQPQTYSVHARTGPFHQLGSWSANNPRSKKKQSSSGLVRFSSIVRGRERAIRKGADHARETS